MYKNILKVGEWVEIHSYDSDDYFDVGEVIAFDDKGVLFAGVDPDGKEDGLVYQTFEDVGVIRKNTQYIQKMKQLLAYQGEKLCAMENVEGDLRIALLKKALQEGKIVSLSFSYGREVDVEGFVSRIEDDFCEIKEYDRDGEEDGSAFFSIDDIANLTYNRQRVKKLYVLIKENKK